MTLHGKIEVNGQTVGSWQARRTTLGLDPDGSAIYDCTVGIHGDEPRVESFRLRHVYEDGALALASAVLVTAQRFILPRAGVEAGLRQFLRGEGTCPKCREVKFIGHGPLCSDCYLGSAS